MVVNKCLFDNGVGEEVMALFERYSQYISTEYRNRKGGKLAKIQMQEQQNKPTFQKIPLFSCFGEKASLIKRRLLEIL